MDVLVTRCFVERRMVLMNSRRRFSQIEYALCRLLGASAGGLLASTLCSRLQLDVSAIIKPLAKLERDGLVEVTGSHVRLTSKARTLLATGDIGRDNPKPWLTIPPYLVSPKLEINSPFTPYIPLLDVSILEERSREGSPQLDK